MEHGKADEEHGPPAHEWPRRHDEYNASDLAPAPESRAFQTTCLLEIANHGRVIAQERLHLRSAGQVVLDLRRRWADGTTYLVFEPLELLERLGALTPRINLLL